jgi:hypothetical protein
MVGGSEVELGVITSTEGNVLPCPVPRRQKADARYRDRKKQTQRPIGLKKPRPTRGVCARIEMRDVITT